MNKVFILFFCLCSCFIQASNKEFLEQAIMDSDLARVQSALSTTYLTEQDKLGLIDLANDIIIKRIKKMEWYQFKPNSSAQEFAAVCLCSFSSLGILFSLFLRSFDYEMSMYEHKYRNKIHALTRAITEDRGAIGFIIFTAAFIGSLYWLKKEFQKEAAYYENLAQLYQNALKIKKIIHDQQCIA